ncbi:recombinase family protein [Bradyrhizobium sp. DASA03007]|uniref:recombinase family protein n=1 Tax=unclassified Bradyrhizobium TaxID=2631580 RepID=UPI003F6EB430
MAEAEAKQPASATDTQSFNTKDAMGRMALNILVTFAQFERELIGERIRDKVAASRKRGKWMGGWTPLGYEVRDRKLLIHDADAERVRAVFRRFVQLKSATLLAREIGSSGIKSTPSSKKARASVRTIAGLKPQHC